MIAELGLTLSLALTGGGAGRVTEAVEAALRDQRALGYEPCEPTLVERDKYGPVPEAAAWASWPETFERCEIGWDPAFNTDDQSWVDYVAWHEVCHLSTGLIIDRDLRYWKAGAMADPYHMAPEFHGCMGALPAPPPPPPGQVQLDVGGFIVTTDVGSLPGADDEEVDLCAELQEAKPWLDWGCEVPGAADSLVVDSQS